jgi:hypothetical protein
MKEKWGKRILGITVGIGIAASKHLWPSHVVAAQMLLYSIAILGIIFLGTWSSKHLPRYWTGMLVVLIFHGSFLYFARRYFPFEGVVVFVIAALVESMMLYGIMLQILGPEGIGKISSAVLASRQIRMREREAYRVADKSLFMPKPLVILVWMVIAVSVIGISSFRFADFRNHNFAYYLCRSGNYTSYVSPGLAILLVAFLWRGYRKGLPVPKSVWVQLGILLFLTLLVGVVFFGP